MDHNFPPMANRVRDIVRAVLFMLRKGISKSKILLELNMMIKRGKLAGKAMIGKLIFLHHAHHHCHDDEDDDNLSFSGPYEYEFSCNNSPEYFPSKLTKRHQYNHHHDGTKFNNSVCALPPPTPDGHDIATMNSVQMEPEKLENGVQVSPMLPRSTRVRQVRVTDSPFPMQDVKENDDQVDRAAEEFIQKFYRQLKKQTKTPDKGY